MVDIDEKTKEKIIQLQVLEQRSQSLLIQKQVFQTQLLEIENAITELEKTKDNVYKLVGPVMVSAKRLDLKKELESKKEILTIRIENIEKQESKIKEESLKIQKEVMKYIQ